MINKVIVKSCFLVPSPPPPARRCLFVCLCVRAGGRASPQPTNKPTYLPLLVVREDGGVAWSSGGEPFVRPHGRAPCGSLLLRV